MNTATRVGAFGAGVALAFGAAFGIGHATGPIGSDPEPAHDKHGAPAKPSAGDRPAADTSGATAAPQTVEVPGGLQVSERGYTLAPDTAAPTAGAASDFRFRVLGPDGAPWTRFDKAHDKEMHLIVARRDLSGFQHVHPSLGADGTWSVPLTFAGAGDHRIFADFTPSGDAAGPLTLGADVAVGGDYEPAPLPAASRTASVDGYTVTLDGDLTAGRSAPLTLNISRDGRPVTDLQPYLGAYGHLVALRQGDLAYLHVHPHGEPGDGVTPSGPGVSFSAEAPSAGAYRLYLDFQHEGEVHTAEFTVNVAGGAAAPPAGTPAAPGDAEGAGHAH